MDYFPEMIVITYAKHSDGAKLVEKSELTYTSMS